MNDDFLNEIKRDWQSLDQDAARHIQRLRRNRWTPHLVFALELSGACASLAVGVWFAWVAGTIAQNKVLFALSAGVMLVAAPALYFASMRARRPALSWSDETPESLLQTGIRRADALLRVLRVGIWHLVVLAAFVAILWLAEASGVIHALQFLKFYSSVCVVVLLTAGGWLIWRGRTLRAERAALTRVLALLRSD